MSKKTYRSIKKRSTSVAEPKTLQQKEYISNKTNSSQVAHKKPPENENLLLEIKKRVIIAMFSDDELRELLVLKGGNALDIVYETSLRSSIDIDFSLAGDFNETINLIQSRIEKSLKTTFREIDFEVFDVKMEQKPPDITPDIAEFWGGYRVEFKLINVELFKKYETDLRNLRNYAVQIGQGKKFLIDISKFEHVTQKKLYMFDDFAIYVYTPEMLVMEKLRAICQQMPEYGPTVKKGHDGGARGRDFLDIHTVITNMNVDITSEENIAHLVLIFKAKNVPLSFLGHIAKYRDFHSEDFRSVRDTVKKGIVLNDFNFYFDYVLGLVEQLKPLWNV
jgi:hypothetical protein